VAASEANLQPRGVAIDAAGNYFITSNNRVFRVDTTGLLTVVAGTGAVGPSGDGGAATSASLTYPYGVAVDASGNVFIADTINHRIRQVEAATGVITTVAGNGTAGFSGDGGAATSASLNYPYGVAVDASGNVFIADSNNHRIRRVEVATGVISTVAGNGTPGFSGDEGPATGTTLYYPFGVAVDASGNIYIADTTNQRIRRVEAPTGLITTVAGNGTGGFSGDGGAATSASLNGPNGVAVDASGNLFIADEWNQRIRRVEAATGVITTVAGNGTAGFSGDGGTATSASLARPTGVAVDASDNLFIAEYSNLRIRRVEAATGVITTAAGNGEKDFSGDGGAATNASLNLPDDVAVDGSGNLSIADYGNGRVRQVEAATGVITTVAGNGTGGFSGDGGAATSASLNGPNGVAVDASGNLFIADEWNQRIRRVEAATGVITTVAGNGTAGFSGDGGTATSASLARPTGVAVDAAGNLFIADQWNYRIRRVEATTGVITTVAGDGRQGFGGDGGAATSASLNTPTRVAVDGSGNLFIADYGNARIRRVEAASGVITTVAGNGIWGFGGDGGAATSANLYFPYGLAVDGSGNLFIADYGNVRVRRVEAASGVITTVAGDGTRGFSEDGGAATSASLNGPLGVAVDASGNLFIADPGNQRVRRVQ
jgi:sugar lactone lactonase YvrE